jgi:hypothetical protein
MFQVPKYRPGGFEIEVWPPEGTQVPILPLMAVGQMIAEATHSKPFRITEVTVREHRAPDSAPFSFYYSYLYEVVEVDD